MKNILYRSFQNMKIYDVERVLLSFYNLL